MEITHYQYVLHVPPAISGVSGHGKSQTMAVVRPIKRKEMKEIVFQAMLAGHTFLVLDRDLGIKSVYILSTEDKERLAAEWEKQNDS